LWRGGLSLRRLSVLVAHLPPDSAVYALRHSIPAGWGLTEFLLTDLYAAFTGQEHPARPKPESGSRASDLAARLKAQRERLAAQAASTP
jgi:hypothetical protein